MLSYYVVVAEKDENKKNFRQKLVDEMMKIFQFFGKLAQLWKKIDKQFYVSEKYTIYFLITIHRTQCTGESERQARNFHFEEKKTPYRRRKVKKL